MTTAAAMPDTAPLKDTLAERSVLGVSMEHGLGRQFQEAGVTGSVFFSEHHRLVWQAIEDLLDEPGGASYLAVRTLLVERRQLDDVGPADLSEMVMGVVMYRPDAVHALAQRLIRLAGARDALVKLQRFESLLLKNATINESFFTALADQLQPIRETLTAADRRIPAHVLHVSEVLGRMRDELTKGPTPFIDFPYPTLNHFLGGGLRSDELMVVGGKPGGGKSALVLQTATRNARAGKTVFIVSREMLAIAIGKRMVLQEGAIDGFRLRRGLLSAEDWAALDVSIGRLSELPLYITSERMRVSDIRRVVEAMRAEGAIDLVVIDYLQLIDVAPGIRDRRQQVEAVSRELKAITTDLNVPVIALSSMNRSMGNERPTLASLRETGNIEFDANVVLLLHRPNGDDSPETTAIVAKGRDSLTGDITLFFRGAQLRFDEGFGSADRGGM